MRIFQIITKVFITVKNKNLIRDQNYKYFLNLRFLKHK